MRWSKAFAFSISSKEERVMSYRMKQVSLKTKHLIMSSLCLETRAISEMIKDKLGAFDASSSTNTIK